MKKFEIDVEINGTITFEVTAKNEIEAERKVYELLEEATVKEALEKYKNSITLNTSMIREKELKERER